MAAQAEVELLNKYGLHQRPAMKVIETASKFAAEIYLIKGDQRCNAKSIIDVIMLAAEKGTPRPPLPGGDAPQRFVIVHVSS